MNDTIFMSQTVPNTFHFIVDTVYSVMCNGFIILSDVFGYYSGIIRLNFLFYATNSL